MKTRTKPTARTELSEDQEKLAQQVYARIKAKTEAAVLEMVRGVVSKAPEDFLRVNFPRAERMLDFSHASEHVTPLAQAVHPHAAAAATEQTKKWCHTLKHEGGPALRKLFDVLDTTAWTADRLETYRAERQYFCNHEHKMDYPRYVAQGWQIGSGTVESSCKRVVTQRLKGYAGATRCATCRRCC